MLALVAIIALLLNIKLRLHIIYENDLNVYIKVLFFKYTVFPEKMEKFSIKKHGNKIAKKKSASNPVLKQRKEGEAKDSLLDKIIFIKEILSVFFKTFANKLKIDIAKLNLKIASPDAAQTAIMYGAISGAVAGILEIIDSYSNLKQLEEGAVIVEPDFLSEKCEAKINISLSITVFGALITLLKTLWKYTTLKNEQ